LILLKPSVNKTAGIVQSDGVRHDGAAGRVLGVDPLDAKDLGSGVFNITMGSVTTPRQMSAAIEAVVPGARVKFDAPAGNAIWATSRSSSCAMRCKTSAIG
jgi:hypothetical protein